jgi:hypothetical protein
LDDQPTEPVDARRKMALVKGAYRAAFVATLTFQPKDLAMHKGFSLEETADGLFILRHGEVEMRLTKEEFFGLKDQINFWTDRALSQFQTRTGEVRPIVSLPIAEVAVWPDAIQENVLLTLTSPSGPQMTLSLPIPVARELSLALPHVLAHIHPSSTA